MQGCMKLAHGYDSGIADNTADIVFAIEIAYKKREELLDDLSGTLLS